MITPVDGGVEVRKGAAGGVDLVSGEGVGEAGLSKGWRDSGEEKEEDERGGHGYIYRGKVGAWEGFGNENESLICGIGSGAR